MNRSYIALFVNEWEVWSKQAFIDGTAPFFDTWSILLVQNTHTAPITVAIADEAISDYEGITLAPRSWNNPGGTFIFDLKANNTAINRLRAKVIGGWSAQLSITVI